MMRRFNMIAIIGPVIALSAWVGRVEAQHADDIWVGRTMAGQLRIGGLPVDEEPIALPPSGGLFNGWADNEPGFDRVVTDDPPNDLLTLQPGAQIWLEVVEMDTAFRAIDTSFNVLDDPGEQTLLGGSTLHIHVTWHINSDDPAFNPTQYRWDATFKLVDTGTTGYADSEPFTMHFANIDCTPGDVNADAAVDMLDVPELVDLLLDPDAATNEQRCAADTNFDGEIDGADVQAFVDHLLTDG